MDANSINMTNTDFLLYWAKFCSSKQNAITPLDRIMLVKNSLFKDKKAVNDAIYRLHIDEKIVKYGDDWYITDYGDAYLEAVLENINKKTNVNAPAKGPKKNEWTDADFGITPEVREYINKLESENAQLKEFVEHYKQMHSSNLATYDELVEKNTKLEKENEALKHEVNALVAKIEELDKELANASTIDANLKDAFQNCAKAFNILANI